MKNPILLAGFAGMLATGAEAADYTTKDSPAPIVVPGLNLNGMDDDVFTSVCTPDTGATLDGVMGQERVEDVIERYRAVVEESSQIDQEEMKGAIMKAMKNLVDSYVSREKITEMESEIQSLRGTNLQDEHAVNAATKKLDAMRVKIAKAESLLAAIKADNLATFLTRYSQEPLVRKAVQDDLVDRAVQSFETTAKWECGDRMNGLTGHLLATNGAIPADRKLEKNRPEMPVLTVTLTEPRSIDGAGVTELINTAEAAAEEMEALRATYLRDYGAIEAEASVATEDPSLANFSFNVNWSK